MRLILSKDTHISLACPFLHTEMVIDVIVYSRTDTYLLLTGQLLSSRLLEVRLYWLTSNEVLCALMALRILRVLPRGLRRLRRVRVFLLDCPLLCSCRLYL